MLGQWTIVIASHAIAASLALVIGPFQILRRTRGDKIHVLIGRTWAVLMLYVAAGSFLFGGYGGAIDIFLRLLAVWTLFSVSAAVYPARGATSGTTAASWSAPTSGSSVRSSAWLPCTPAWCRHGSSPIR
jgi:uncharacterized membrane protein